MACTDYNLFSENQRKHKLYQNHQHGDVIKSGAPPIRMAVVFRHASRGVLGNCVRSRLRRNSQRAFTGGSGGYNALLFGGAAVGGVFVAATVSSIVVNLSI